MKKANLFFVFILVSIFCFTRLSCRQQYSYEEVKKKFEANRYVYEDLSKKFLNQEVCFTFDRKDFSKTHSIFPSSSETYIIYWITPLVDLKKYEIYISKEFEGNEDEFWKKDYKDIKENEIDNLETFLNRYQISRNFFDEYKDFLKVNECHFH